MRERERERIGLLKRKYSEKIKIKNIFYVEAVLSCQLRRFLCSPQQGKLLRRFLIKPPLYNNPTETASRNQIYKGGEKNRLNRYL